MKKDKRNAPSFQSKVPDWICDFQLHKKSLVDLIAYSS